MGLVGVAWVGALIVAKQIGRAMPEGYQHQSGLMDLGHLHIPSLLSVGGREHARVVWWLASLPLEIICLWLVAVGFFMGKHLRVSLAITAVTLLHWICWRFTVMPLPDDIVWQMPGWAPTFMVPFTHDLWFSGHVGNAMIIALATRGARRSVQALAWGGVVFQAVVVLGTRVHYSIDIIGAVFVAYAVHKATLDAQTFFRERFPWTRRLEDEDAALF